MHAAIMWTVVAFFAVLLWGREKWTAVSFWIFWAVCLVLHIIAMWAIFGFLLPRLALGTIYVVPIAFIESVLLAALFFIIERKIRNHSVTKISFAPRFGDCRRETHTLAFTALQRQLAPECS